MPKPHRSTTTRRMHRRTHPPHACAQCGTTGTPLYQDHITNLAAGGTDTPDNLQWLCHTCHTLKTRAEITAGIRAYHARRYNTPEPHPGHTPQGGGG